MVIFRSLTSHIYSMYPNMPITGLTGIPVVEADIFVSGNGGGANDLCNHLFRNISTDLDSNPCFHSGPVLPVNETNYVFDIYPPGTDYTQTEATGVFRINAPTRDGSGNDVSLLTHVNQTERPKFLLTQECTPGPEVGRQRQ